jgi:p-hydroxybenzoate 3-monooxygenase
LRTQVGIIGAGPAGLLLAHLLRAEGIECVVVERQTRARVQDRIRAGVLERTTTDLLHRLGIDARLNAEGLSHDGFALADDGQVIRIDIAGLTGHHVTVYGQTEVTRDLIDAADARGLPIVWESRVTRIEGIGGDQPVIVHGNNARLQCDFVAGCDGFHGAARAALPDAVRRTFERAYPFGWLGVLADVPPCDHELIYASHDRGFALASMRSPTRSRYYVQVGLDERVEDWSDDRFWDELATRLGADVAARIVRGPSLEKSIAPLRSFVGEPMQHGRLFLAGDAAHIVPPTGAKGLNLASSDVAYLSDALIGWYARGDESGLAGYGARALARVWKAERFSWYLTKLMHRFPEDGAFERRMQLAELDYIAQSSAMQTAIAENYVGLPL